MWISLTKKKKKKKSNFTHSYDQRQSEIENHSFNQSYSFHPFFNNDCTDAMKYIKAAKNTIKNHGQFLFPFIWWRSHKSIPGYLIPWIPVALRGQRVWVLMHKGHIVRTWRSPTMPSMAALYHTGSIFGQCVNNTKPAFTTANATSINLRLWKHKKAWMVINVL